MRTLKKPLKKAICLLAAAAGIVVPYELSTATAGTIWHPTADASISWAWQLSGTPSLANHVQMYDIDGFDNTAATVAALHAQGTIAVCYIDFGTWENWRSDQAQFPSSVLGSSNGWPGEKWLDISKISTLAPIMTARMQMCVQKGFDALEPDNIDGYSNSTGFPLTAQNQLAYNEWIANTAHSLGLSVGLKNDVDQAAQLQPYFDWTLNEQCNEFSECDTLSPFTAANKAVFNAEYGSSTSFCAADIAAHINGVRFDLGLDGKTDVPCGGWGTPSAPSPTTAPTTTPTTAPAATNPTSTTTGGGGVTSTTLAAPTSTTQPAVGNPGGPTSTTTRTTRTPRRGTSTGNPTTTTTKRSSSSNGPTHNRRHTATTVTAAAAVAQTSTATSTSTGSWHHTWFSQGWLGNSNNDATDASGGSNADVSLSPMARATTTTLPKHHHDG